MEGLKVSGHVAGQTKDVWKEEQSRAERKGELARSALLNTIVH